VAGISARATTLFQLRVVAVTASLRSKNELLSLVLP